MKVSNSSDCQRATSCEGEVTEVGYQDVIDNISCKVELEDFERGSFEGISDSLHELKKILKCLNTFL